MNYRAYAWAWASGVKFPIVKEISDGPLKKRVFAHEIQQYSTHNENTEIKLETRLNYKGLFILFTETKKILLKFYPARSSWLYGLLATVWSQIYLLYFPQIWIQIKCHWNHGEEWKQCGKRRKKEFTTNASSSTLFLHCHRPSIGIPGPLSWVGRSMQKNWATYSIFYSLVMERECYFGSLSL